MSTQHDAAKLYTELQETAAANEAWQQCADADWYRRHPDERAGRVGELQATADAETRHAMGAVVYVVAGLGVACLALIAFLLPWAALLQWAATADTRRYLLTTLGFLALIVGGLLWRGRK